MCVLSSIPFYYLIVSIGLEVVRLDGIFATVPSVRHHFFRPVYDSQPRAGFIVFCGAFPLLQALSAIFPKLESKVDNDNEY